ncbi:MAG TPA: hypothetical protein VGP48_13205 [Stellaceae bacterium]|jgi:hypothetical protein|nr:hypothetical protein [Stellaceae bacterium]
MMQRAVTILAIAFFLTIAFQTYQLIREHSYLQATEDGQQAPLEQAAQVRQDAEALAGGTAALADKGNANAKQVVEIMRQQGITLRAPQATAAPASP